MSEFNSYFQAAGESIAHWTQRLNAIDAKKLDKNEQTKLDSARRGIPPQKEAERKQKTP